MNDYYLSGTGVSAKLLVRTLPILSICLVFLLFSGPAGAFEYQSLDQTESVTGASVPHAALQRTPTAGGEAVEKNLSCAVYLNRADRRRDFSASTDRVEFTARPKSSFGLVVGIRVALGPDSVKRARSSSVDFWRPGAIRNAREEALDDYRRCKTGQALNGFGR